MDGNTHPDFQVPAHYKGILNNRFYIITSLGEEGGNGKAYLAVDSHTNQRVAIKKMKTNLVKDKEMVQKEGEAMQRVDHPNVLSVISYGEGVCVDRNGNQETWLFLILELAQEDTLFDYIVDSGPFGESVAAYFFEQFIKGLQAIHLQGMSHRDIKCENVFMDRDFNLKIADFGYANVLSDLKT